MEEVSKREKRLHVLVNNAGAAWGDSIDTYPVGSSFFVFSALSLRLSVYLFSWPLVALVLLVLLLEFDLRFRFRNLIYLYIIFTLSGFSLFESNLI